MKYILSAIALINCLTLKGQIQIPNSDFEIADPTAKTGAMNWLSGGNSDTCIADNTVVYSGGASMKLFRSAATGNGIFHQDFPFNSKKLSRYKISCAIKTENLQGKAGLGARVLDKDGNTICGYNAITVTKDQDWKVLEGEFYSDEAAVSVKIFGNLQGSGNCWFDNISIEEILMAENKTSKKISKYIDEYFSYIHQYSVIKDTLYLEHLYQNTKALCGGHNDMDYCHIILKRYTTLKLNDGHSFFWTPDDWKDYRNGSKNTSLGGLVNFADGKMISSQIAYINVPTFASMDNSIIQNYVDSLQKIIRILDTQKPRGWIIDLSKNQGGNSFAMIPGLGPLLGNGICGYSQSGDGSYRTRIYNNGYAGWDQDTTFMQKSPVYNLIHKDLPIAVIYGNTTGSSGEVLAISFRGKDNTKSFGQETYGATTRVDNLEMSDGATLNLACGWDADRTGKVYRSKVPPDVSTQTQDEALKEASKWILDSTK